MRLVSFLVRIWLLKAWGALDLPVLGQIEALFGARMGFDLRHLWFLPNQNITLQVVLLR